MDEWISIKDRLPTKDDTDAHEWVLARDRYGRVDTHWYITIQRFPDLYVEWKPYSIKEDN